MRRTILFLLLLLVLHGCANEEKEDENGFHPLPKGTIYGWVKDTTSKEPIPNAQVTLKDLSTTTDQDGNFYFLDVEYSDNLPLKVSAAHYKPYSESINLNQSELSRVIYLERDFDAQKEIETVIGRIEELIASDDPDNIPALKSLFSRQYEASNDDATIFVVSLGLIPKNYEDIFPCVSSIFKKYDEIKFDFSDIKVKAPTAYRGQAKMMLTIHVKKVEKEEIAEVDLKCTMSLSRGAGDWKISRWKLDEIIEIRQ
jgi:hypothetical protein